MDPAESILPPDVSLGELLAQLPKQETACDPTALRRAALSTLGRRSSVQPRVALLVEDAVAVALQVLKGHMGAVTQIVGETLWTRWFRLDERGRLVDPKSHQEPFDGTGSLAGYAIARGETVVVSDFAREMRFQDRSIRSRGAGAALCVPIHLREEIFGALTLCLPTASAIPSDDVEFVESVASFLSTSIARDKAERDLQRLQVVADQSVQILRNLGIATPETSPALDVLLLPSEECVSRWPGDAAEPVSRYVREHVVSQERRTSHRRPFPYWQPIGPVIGGLLPARKSFFPALCRDISSGGLSVELTALPEFRDMVIQLGPADCPTYLMARIVHVTRVSADGSSYRVGCSFTGRLQL